MRDILNHIKVLFFGVSWHRAEIYSFKENSVHHYSIINPEVDPAEEKAPSSSKILGFNIDHKASFQEAVPDIIKNIQPETFGALFLVTQTRKDATYLIKTLEILSFSDIELYGADPDYFYSLAPLTTDYHETIEQYILGLKTDFSFAGKFKQIIKNVMIHTRLSGKLYEYFVITAQP